MAERTTKATVKEQVTQEQAAAMYSVAELSKAANRFGTKEECVIAALGYYGVENASIKDAQEIVKKFLNKEVK